MNIGKWLLTAAAAIVVVGAGMALGKRNKNRNSAALQYEHDIDELTEVEARQVLAKVYKLDAEALFDHLDNPRIMLDGPSAVATVRGRNTTSLTLIELVAHLEARANVLSAEKILDADDMVTLLNSGYEDGRLPLNVGHWWSKAGATPEPNFYELAEMLARAKK